jgi:DNA-binding winged helix-turn-helix (wHTH) protein/Flp pilus assembly protein TadD
LRDFSQQDELQIGEWRAVRATGELSRGSQTERLEPKVMDLLFLLASKPQAVFTRDDIMDALWPKQIVGDDTLARVVSRLRKALADDAKEPAYIETLPKRGYRLIAAVIASEADAQQVPSEVPASARRRAPAWQIGAVGLVVALLATAAIMLMPSQAPDREATLIERANDYYFQYRRPDNEAAIALFERILTERPDYAPALAGLANALVQKAIRWPDAPGAREYTKLSDALRSGRTRTDSARTLLARALTLADRAVDLSPSDATVLKAKGFVESARGDLDGAIRSYQRAVALDDNAWGPLINIGDVLEIQGKPKDALAFFERAYAAMTRVYDLQAARIRPWYGELGVLIGDRYRDRGEPVKAEPWYRRVLVYAPLHPAATSHLAALLRTQGDATAAESLCSNLRLKTGNGCKN